MNGVEIGCDTRDFLERWELAEHWERLDQAPYASEVRNAIEIEAGRLVMVYVRDSGVGWEELMATPEKFRELQERAQRTACENVLMVVDRTDLIAVYCE